MSYDIPFGDSLFDRKTEQFFEAVDELFSRRSLLMGTLVLPLMATPVQSLCEHIQDEDFLSLYGATAMKNDISIDTVEREICYRFTPLVPALIIEPDHICAAVDEDAEDQLLVLKFPSGASLDLSEDYTLDAMRHVFDGEYKACINKGLNI